MKRILIALSTMLFFLCSCGGSGTKISECKFKPVKSGMTVTKDGKPVTGTIVSDDGNTLKMEAKDGKIESIVIYHANGKVAVDVKNKKLYDEEGASINDREFRKKYPELDKQGEKILKQLQSLTER